MPDTPRRKEALSRTSTLRRRADFELTKSDGRRVTGKCLALNWLCAPGIGRKFAVIAPKAVGHAVMRNLLKRRVRENYRRTQTVLPLDLWSIWIIRKPASHATFLELKEEMMKLYSKARLLNTSDPLCS